MANEHYDYHDTAANGGSCDAAVAIMDRSGNDDGGCDDAVAIHGRRQFQTRHKPQRQQQRRPKRIRQRKAKLPVHVQVATSLLAIYACCDGPSGGTEAFRGLQQQQQQLVRNTKRPQQQQSPLFATVENEQEQQVSTSSSSSSSNPLHKALVTENLHFDSDQKLFSKDVRELLLAKVEKKPYYADKSTSKISIPTVGVADTAQPTKNGVTIVANGKNGIHVPPKLPLVDDSSNDNAKIVHTNGGEASFTTVMDELDSLSDFDGTTIDPSLFDHQRNQMELLDLQAWEETSLATSTTANATQQSKSRIRRFGSMVRRTLGHYSPVRIFADGHSNVDEKSESVTVSSSSAAAATTTTKQQQSYKGELFATEATTTANSEGDNNKRKKKKEQKKQSKEEAMVARMSRKKKKQLSNLLKSVNRRNAKSMAGITSRSLTGLIAALAEEAEGLSVRMHALEDTPIWRKEIDMLTIEFTRLGFKPLSLGGPDQQLLPPNFNKGEKNNIKKALQGAAASFQPPDMEKLSQSLQNSMQKQRQQLASTKPPFLLQQKGKNNNKDDDGDDDSCPVEMVENPMAGVSCADTAFQTIDVDNSGALDKDEIADALVLAASASSPSPFVVASKKNNDTDANNNSLPAAAAAMGEKSRKVIQKLAKQLVDLYDTNDDGVIDRMEYQSMVEDMAALRQVQKEREEKERKEREEKDREESTLR